MTGRDTRTPEQLREDIKLLNGIDLGEDPRLHLEMFIKGAGSGDVFNQRAAINPKLEAWNKLTSVITYDRFMSTTASLRDPESRPIRTSLIRFLIRCTNARPTGKLMN